MDLSASASSIPPKDLPPIAALFVIYFDIKAGQTIIWKKFAQGVSLSGVEFKSLPSGLHNLVEDLVYFVQAPYAGISAFINTPAAEAERNACMLSVGVLVPLSYGRLGRSWRHAENLKELAKKFAANTEDHAPLEEYYELNRIHESTEAPESPAESPSSLRYRPSSRYKPPFDSLNRHSRTRSISDTTALAAPGQALSPYHPALSLPEFVDTFGPLVFPLYRAALTRQRILLITGAPVELACNFVYDISILSNIPLSVADLLSSEPSRLRPLFSIGVHDIPLLEEEAKRIHPTSQPPHDRDHLGGEQGSWVACTTDGILYLKNELYDVVVSMPPAHSKNAKKKVWPTIECPAGTPIKATQRDLARYRALKRSLARYKNTPPSIDLSSPTQEEDRDSREEEVCEKPTWREIAYSSFMWWASAGEKRRETETAASDELFFEDSKRPRSEVLDDAVTNDEEVHPLLPTSPRRNNSSPLPRSHHRRRSSAFSVGGAGGGAGSDLGNMEMDIVAYFHRLTGRLMAYLAKIVDDGEDDGGAGGDGEAGDGDEVFISLEDLDKLGLDRHSELDVTFVKNICLRYFGREAAVEGVAWECCGIRYC
ncbi:unnamed protein product [Tuber melanosporum]|uniref:(Perigord truffle) hypothetical protein n=1 Tax=Tuber melanosporum (strain Mel28) TaxID=656061 RepID=D5G5F9_TUBMM|nr:uncharacterized protein GSTUM_00004317001 [Tuber melanosporum]CAZ79752.1 unnamed protein product [Tuber melanosporum]